MFFVYNEKRLVCSRYGAPSLSAAPISESDAIFKKKFGEKTDGCAYKVSLIGAPNFFT